MTEPQSNYGAKDVTVEISTDDSHWTALTGVPVFSKAPGGVGYFL